MRKINKVTFWLLLLCGGCFLVAWNLHLMLADRPRVLITLTPEEVEMQTAFPEGAAFQAEFTLENKTRADLTIKKILSSCGCTAVSTKEGQPLKVPFVLSPSKPFPILVTVDTQNRVGKYGVSVVFHYEHDGKPLVSAGKILFEVIEQGDAFKTDSSDTEPEDIQNSELGANKFPAIAKPLTRPDTIIQKD